MDDDVASTSVSKTKRSRHKSKSSTERKKHRERAQASRPDVRADEDDAASDDERHLLKVRGHGDDNNDAVRPDPRAALTQEHIVQLFAGELDEFAALLSGSRDVHHDRHFEDSRHHRVQYVVEHEISGDFFRIRGAQRRKHTSSNLHRTSTLLSRASTRLQLQFGKSGTPDSHSLLQSRDAAQSGANLRDVETALVVMCQGILAGLCWMDAFNLSSSDAFACAYSAVADRSRQLFFILFKYPTFCLYTT